MNKTISNANYAHIKYQSMAKKVLFINQEIAPYVPETALSIMGRDLPTKMQEEGFEIRTFMPNGEISTSAEDNFMR